MAGLRALRFLTPTSVRLPVHSTNVRVPLCARQGSRCWWCTSLKEQSKVSALVGFTFYWWASGEGWLSDQTNRMRWVTKVWGKDKLRWGVGEEDCCDGWAGGRGGSRGSGLMWDGPGVFEESQGGLVPRAEPGVAWEEMRSLSESVFSGAGFLLVSCSLSEMGSPWRVEQRRGRLSRALTGSLASE